MEELSELYKMVLLYKIYDGKDISYDIDEVWENIQGQYYRYNNVYTDDRDILFSWMKEKARYPLLDNLMIQVFARFISEETSGPNGEMVKNEDYDPFFISNIYEMKRIFDNYKEEIDIVKEKVNLSKLDRRKVTEMVCDILSEIDPTLEWLGIYKDVIDKKLIIYFDLLNKEEKLLFGEMMGIDFSEDDNNSCMFINSQKKAHIFLTYTGTINDVTNTVHEIVHYICRYKNDFEVEVPILKEFSSIFFELYSLEYLKRMGYSELELRTINSERINSIRTFYDDVMILYDYLIMLMENGKIDEEIDNDHEKADKCIDTLITNPFLLNEHYPYLMGYYLATNGIKRSKNDKFIVPMTKYLTDNLANVDAYDIFYLMGRGNNNLVKYDKELFQDGVKKKKKVK